MASDMVGKTDLPRMKVSGSRAVGSGPGARPHQRRAHFVAPRTSAHAADSGLNELPVLMSQHDRPMRRRVVVAAIEQREKKI